MALCHEHHDGMKLEVQTSEKCRLFVLLLISYSFQSCLRLSNIMILSKNQFFHIPGSLVVAVIEYILIEKQVLSCTSLWNLKQRSEPCMKFFQKQTHEELSSNKWHKEVLF